MSGASFESLLQQSLGGWQDPHTGCGLPPYALCEHDFSGGHLRVRLDPGYPTDARKPELCALLAERLQKLEGVEQVQVELAWKVRPARPQGKLRSLPEVKNLVAVASAKGGVGKSTVAVNLALALAAEGAATGLLDADIYGPSQQMMLGIPAGQRPKTRPPKYLAPLEAHGLQSMSIAYLLTEKMPLVWRGPMVSSALQQLLTQTLWKELDYLVVDLPPGTGDIQLTLAQKAPLAGAVIVSTPQPVALADARKGVEMFHKLGVSVLGVVENMGVYRCPHCGEEEAIFDRDGGERMARECELPLLGSLPLDPVIRRQTDGGAPPVVAEPEGRAAQEFRSIARCLAARLALCEPEQENVLRVTDLTDAAATQGGDPT